MVRTPPPHLHWTIVTSQISPNVWLPPRPPHTDRKYVLQQVHLIQAVLAHKDSGEPRRETRRVMLFPASHLALLVLPLLSSVLKTSLSPSLIQIPTRPLQTHCERELQKGMNDGGCGNYNSRRCLHLDQWSFHSRTIHRVGHWDMTRLVFAMGRIMELYIWHRRPFMSAS